MTGDMPGDIPSDYWGEPEIQDNTRKGGLRNKRFRYNKRKFSFGYFVFIFDLKEKTSSKYMSNTDMYGTWYHDNPMIFNPADLTVSDTYRKCTTVLILFGDRGKTPEYLKYPIAK